MTHLTPEQEAKVRDLTSTIDLCSGLGDGPEHACSVAAINLALTGELTDAIPDCMSEVIGKWIIVTQDAMPDELRRSEGWRELLPLAAGTGRDHEPERLAVLLDWMWGTVLPVVQPVADDGGFGVEWASMCDQRTAEAAEAAAWAARADWDSATAAGRAAATAAARDSARAATAAAWAAACAADAQRTAEAAEAAAWAARADWDSATAAGRAAATAAARDSARAAACAAWAASRAADAWGSFDPVGTLRRIIEVAP